MLTPRTITGKGGMGMLQLFEINHNSFSGAGYCQTLNFKWLKV